MYFILSSFLHSNYAILSADLTAESLTGRHIFVPQYLSYAGIVRYLRWCSDVAVKNIDIKDNMETFTFLFCNLTANLLYC